MNTNLTIYPDEFIAEHCPSEQHLATLPLRGDIVKLETDGYGVGIFALRPYYRGDVIGSFIAEQTSELLQHSLQRSPSDNLHDPHFIGFLLHSCSPNVVLDMHQQKVFCIRDIEANSPLFMDYASTEDQLFNQFACGCGAPQCRGWITGRAEHVNQEGKLALDKYNVPYIKTAEHVVN